MSTQKEIKITKRATNYSQWYLDIIDVADLAVHSPLNGFIIIKPYGYAIWEIIKDIIDRKIQDTGVQNFYFPLLIPENLIHIQEDFLESLFHKVAAVTYAGGKKLKKALIIRPNSELLISETLSNWIISHKDLPFLANQWTNIVRWEKNPLFFLRSKELLCQEGLSVHATREEADKRAKLMLNVYKEFSEKYLAIPVFQGIKPQSEETFRTLYSYTLEAMTQDGKAVQIAVVNNLGQNFSKAFDIKFTAVDGNVKYCWQTSWSLSLHAIGAMIMTHSDDKGLILPPKMAPIHLVIIPIWYSEKDKKEVNEAIEATVMQLNNCRDIKFKVDKSDIRPGEKYYKWEKKGIPLRLEVGPNEARNKSIVIARRDSDKKTIIGINNLIDEVINTLDEIQINLYERALKRKNEKTKIVDSYLDFVREIKMGNFVMAYCCEDSNIVSKIKKETGAAIKCIPLNQEYNVGKCIFSGLNSNRRVLFALSY